MAGVALKVGEGDAAVRCGSVVGCREIVILGRALDGMLDALQKSAHKLRALSMHDPLTGLWNRRQFTEMALREIRVSGRYGHRLALGMADIDHFQTCLLYTSGIQRYGKARQRHDAQNDRNDGNDVGKNGILDEQACKHRTFLILRGRCR